jgi:hypothetical protein
MILLRHDFRIGLFISPRAVVLAREEIGLRQSRRPIQLPDD